MAKKQASKPKLKGTGPNGRLTVKDLPKGWYEKMIECGRKGKTQRYLCTRVLKISQPAFDKLQRNEEDFKEAVEEFRAEAAIYWEELAEAYARGDEKVLSMFSNFNALKYNIKNRSYIGWHDKEVVDHNTTVQADESAHKLFAKILDSTKQDN